MNKKNYLINCMRYSVILFNCQLTLLCAYKNSYCTTYCFCAAACESIFFLLFKICLTWSLFVLYNILIQIFYNFYKTMHAQAHTHIIYRKKLLYISMREVPYVCVCVCIYMNYYQLSRTKGLTKQEKKYCWLILSSRVDIT